MWRVFDVLLCCCCSQSLFFFAFPPLQGRYRSKRKKSKLRAFNLLQQKKEKWEKINSRAGSMTEMLTRLFPPFVSFSFRPQALNVCGLHWCVVNELCGWESPALLRWPIHHCLFFFPSPPPPVGERLITSRPCSALCMTPLFGGRGVG